MRRTVALIAFAGCHAAKAPEPPRLCVAPRLEAPRFDPPPAPDLFGALPADYLATSSRREAPLAFVRAGDAVSGPAIVAARHAIATHACAGAARAVAALPSAHPDRDYVRYLRAWCEHVGGDRGAARAELAELAASTEDEQLRPFLADELVEVVVRDADVRDAVAAVDAGKISRDRLAVALFAAGRQLEGRFVVGEAPAQLPHGAEVACRTLVAQCRAALHDGMSWGTVWHTCGDPPPGDACGERSRTAELQALLAWRDNRWDPDRAAVAAAMRRWLAPGVAHPRFDRAARDQLSLALVVLDFDASTRAPAAWDAVGKLAAHIADTAVDHRLGEVAVRIAAAAHRNAEQLAAFGRCPQVLRRY